MVGDSYHIGWTDMVGNSRSHRAPRIDYLAIRKTGPMSFQESFETFVEMFQALMPIIKISC